MRCLPNLEKDVIDDVNMEELYSLNSLCHHLMQWNVQSPSGDRHTMWCDSLPGDPEDVAVSVPAPCTLLAPDNNMDTGHGEWRVDSGQCGHCGQRPCDEYGCSSGAEQ